jgi:hypothetical protein
MTEITWTNTRVRLGDLKPWADNPRMSTKAQARRLLQSFDTFGQVLNHLGLNGYFPRFCQFVTRTTETNEIRKLICLLVIAMELVCWNNVMNFNISWFLVFVSALLAGVVISPESFIALAYPVLAVCNPPTMTMNKGRISYTHHGFSTTHPRATRLFGFSPFYSRGSYSKFLSATRTNMDNLFSSFRHSGFAVACLAAISLIFTYQRLKGLIANGAVFHNPPFSFFSIKLAVAPNAAKIVPAISKHVGLYPNPLSAISAFCVYHVAPKRKSPFATPARVSQRGRFDCISDLLACPSKSVNRDYTTKLEQAC